MNTFVVAIGELDVEFPEYSRTGEICSGRERPGPELVVEDVDDLAARLRHLLPPLLLLPLTGESQQHLHSVISSFTLNINPGVTGRKCIFRINSHFKFRRICYFLLLLLNFSLK